MSNYTVADLTKDIIQRVGRLDNKAGITLLGALNSVQSLLASKLLESKSDLLADNNLALAILANGCSATLPVGFVAMAEKPIYKVFVDEPYANYIVGQVTAYNTSTGVLQVTVLSVSGTGTCSSWDVAKDPGTVIGTSSSILAYPAVGNSITIAASTGMAISVGDAVHIVPHGETLIYDTLAEINNRLQPHYLGNDDEDTYDTAWWSWYGMYGWELFPPTRYPSKYKIVNRTLYVRPYVSNTVYIIGKYYGTPELLSSGASIIPFNGLFDEIFREGAVRIIQRGMSLPEADAEFMVFFLKRFEAIMIGRNRLQPKNRTHYSSFM